MLNIMRTTKDLFNTNKAFRITVYVVICLLTFVGCFKLGKNFGEFLYMLMH